MLSDRLEVEIRYYAQTRPDEPAMANAIQVKRLWRSDEESLADFLLGLNEAIKHMQAMINTPTPH